MTERRLDPLTGEWRTFEEAASDLHGESVDSCRFCVGTAGCMEAEGSDVFVFDERFPAPTPSPPWSAADGFEYEKGLAAGACEVVVHDKDHHITMAGLGVERIADVIYVWGDRYAELGSRSDVSYVFIFEDRGGDGSSQHPHSQIHGYPEIPPVPRRELDQARVHLSRFGTCVVCDIVARERTEAVRVVARNATFLAYVPFAARFAYEVHVTAHRHATSLLDLTEPERRDLAALLDVVVRCYDNLFGFASPYAMSMHQAPTDDGQHLDVAHFHVEFTSSHTNSTNMAHAGGCEVGAGTFSNDVPPETAAAALREAML